MDPYWKSADGKHAIWCADCMDVLPTLADGSVDSVITDPPYGIGFGKYESHEDNADAYESLIVPCVKECCRVSKEGAMLFFWQGMKNASRWSAWFPDGWRLFAGLRNFTQFLPTPVQYSWDPVVWWTNGKCKRKAVAGQRDYHMGNTAKYVAEKSNGHPCPRPLDTVTYVVTLATDEHDIILDPFFGSGTCGVACVKTGRRFLGIERERKYCDIAVKRMEKALEERAASFDFMREPEPVQATLWE